MTNQVAYLNTNALLDLSIDQQPALRLYPANNVDVGATG